MVPRQVVCSPAQRTKSSHAKKQLIADREDIQAEKAENNEVIRRWVGTDQSKYRALLTDDYLLLENGEIQDVALNPRQLSGKPPEMRLEQGTPWARLLRHVGPAC